jgi:CO/xanthine dehydrogenase Mo-binding subunit
VGEGGIVGIAAAVANAVANATGVRIRDLPVTPERVLRALTSSVTTASGPRRE